MYCPNGCCVWGMYPQPMVETDAGNLACPQCGHEIRENDAAFKCACVVCKKSLSTG
jgi:hypothetical protein